ILWPVWNNACTRKLCGIVLPTPQRDDMMAEHILMSHGVSHCKLLCSGEIGGVQYASAA
ncbi:hypothetical protein BaRGS_00009620, partial [Batillaria attramentaria]